MSEEIKDTNILPSDEVEVKEEPKDESLLSSEEHVVPEGLPSEAVEEVVDEVVEEVVDEPKEEVKEEAKEESIEEPTEDNWASKYISEFKSTGDISEESVDAIVKEHGLSKDIVQDYVRMSKETQKAASDAAAAEIFKEVGGKESYESMVKWGADNLSEKEIKAFDDKIAIDIDSAHMAVAWLKQKYMDAGNASTFIEGHASTMNTGYKNALEFQKDIGDQRYYTDASYRKRIDAKLDRTTVKLY